MISSKKIPDSGDFIGLLFVLISLMQRCVFGRQPEKVSVAFIDVSFPAADRNGAATSPVFKELILCRKKYLLYAVCF